MSTLLWIVAAVAAYLAYTLALNLPRQLRIRRLAKSRADADGFVEFRRSFPEIPETLCRRVYASLQDLVAKGFPVHAEDDLSSALEVDQGSLEELLTELLPNRDRADGSAVGTIVTAGDL